jgi:hypothetical protein
MEKTRNWLLEYYVAIIILVVFVGAFFVAVHNPDVDFARRVL